MLFKKHKVFNTTLLNLHIVEFQALVGMLWQETTSQFQRLNKIKGFLLIVHHAYPTLKGRKEGGFAHGHSGTMFKEDIQPSSITLASCGVSSESHAGSEIFYLEGIHVTFTALHSSKAKSLLTSKRDGEALFTLWPEQKESMNSFNNYHNGMAQMERVHQIR